MKLTENFTLEEMVKSSTATRKGIKNVPDEDIKKNLKALCEKILQPLREAWGESIVVSSGFRCRKLNSAIGGAKTSDHMYGNAADIHTVSDKPEDNKKLFETAVALMGLGKIKDVKQIIDEYGYNWIHISFQDGRSAKRNQVLHLK